LAHCFGARRFDRAISREGDLMKVIHALAQDVGVLGVFSDWPAAVTYYANCMRRNGRDHR
jgi:glycerophosphoryl diester phosphodiesterase